MQIIPIILASFLVTLSFSCASSKNAARDPASSQQEVNDWIKKYKEARSISRISTSKSCDLFKELNKLDSPNKETKALLGLREKQTCEPEGFHLVNLEKWLKKDAIFFGLRHTEKKPESFLKYYETYLELDTLERAEVEFLERYRLTKNAHEVAKKKKDTKRLDQLRKNMPLFYVLDQQDVPEEALFEAAYGLRMIREFGKAKKIYNQIISSTKNQLENGQNKKEKILMYSKLSRAYELLRTCYRVEENKEQGIVISKKAAQYLKNTYEKNKMREYATPYTNHVVQLARDIWTEGQREEGRKLLEDTLKIVKKSASLDQVYWVLGRMKQEENKFEESIELFRKALDVNEDKEFGLKLQWLIAWNLKQHDKHKESIEEFEKLAKMAKKQLNDVNLYKALYWQAQLLKNQGHESKYKDLLEDISEDNFFGYYGRLAALELGDVSLFKARSKEPEKSESSVSKEFLDKIRILKLIEETDVLSSLIQYEWRELSRSERSSYSKKKEFAFYYHFAELYRQNQQFIEIFSYDDKLDLYKDHPYFFFPYPHQDLIKHHTSKMNVPKEIVYSLMRQESLFDPKARSPADAFGLLQLIPRIARLYEKQVGVVFEKHEDLYNPEVIVPLGVAHLAKLMAQYHGSMLLTAASYNAGTIPVNGWLKSKDSRNVFEFVENIPYAETEAYVKLVFRNLSFYSFFDEQLSPEQRISFLKNYFVFKQEIVAGQDLKQ